MTLGDSTADSRTIGRRGILRSAVAATVAALVPPIILSAGTAEAAPFGGAARKLSLVNINTQERFDGIYWADGAYVQEAVRRIDTLLRDHRANKVCQYDRSLFDALWQVRRALDTDEPFEVVCGYRSRATNAAARRQRRGVARDSYHVKGMAVDVRMNGRGVPAISRAAIDLGAGGVGTYRRSGFVHMDTGPVRTW